MKTDAIFSEDREYRYVLLRQWDSTLSPMMVIGLNPSTADETEDDPTIRRCKRFADDWGYGGLIMTNLFAIKATDPKVMLKHPDPIGADNDKWLIDSAQKAGIVLAAWGNHGTYKARDHEVLLLVGKIKQMHCLKKTKIGQPGHPLYIKADTKPILY